MSDSVPYAYIGDKPFSYPECIAAYHKALSGAELSPVEAELAVYFVLFYNPPVPGWSDYAMVRRNISTPTSQQLRDLILAQPRLGLWSKAPFDASHDDDQPERDGEPQAGIDYESKPYNNMLRWAILGIVMGGPWVVLLVELFK